MLFRKQMKVIERDPKAEAEIAERLAEIERLHQQERTARMSPSIKRDAAMAALAERISELVEASKSDGGGSNARTIYDLSQAYEALARTKEY